MACLHGNRGNMACLHGNHRNMARLHDNHGNMVCLHGNVGSVQLNLYWLLSVFFALCSHIELTLVCDSLLFSLKTTRKRRKPQGELLKLEQQVPGRVDPFLVYFLPVSLLLFISIARSSFYSINSDRVQIPLKSTNPELSVL